jgi:hypothetical protein
LKKGEAKNVLVRDGLSEKLTLVKESLLKASSSGTTSGDSTSAKKPKEPAAGKNESPPKKVKQDTQEQYRPIQSSRIQESGSLHISSGGIPHGVGIPPVPLQPQPQVNPMGRFGVGDVDLDPFRAAPGLIPGMPMDPRNRPMNPMNPGGGMHVGPDHPMFQPPLNNPYGPSNPYGPPPGARFDPVMPFGPGGGRPIRPARPGRPPFGYS